MEERDYRFKVNFITTYEVEVRARSLEEAKGFAANDAMDMFCTDVNTGEIDPTYFTLDIEEDE